MGFCSHHHHDSAYASATSTHPLSTSVSPIVAIESFYLAQYNASRRRSVDTGGLALALRDPRAAGSASSPHTSTTATKAFTGWSDSAQRTTIPYAEMLSRLFIQTQPSTCLLDSDNDGTANPSFIPSSSSSSSSPSSSCIPPISPQTRTRLLQHLASWSFDSLSLSPDDLFYTTCLIFDVLFTIENFSQSIGNVQPHQLRPLLHALRSVYGWHDNTYHNFQHAVDVLQAMYVFLVDAGCVPPVSILLDDDAGAKRKSWKRSEEPKGILKDLLSNVDVFMLFLAAIGHDAGHPGLNNGFMKSAGTCLSAMYDHTSTLERMHCTLLLQLMRNFGLEHLIRSDNVVLFPVQGQTPHLRTQAQAQAQMPVQEQQQSPEQRQTPEVANIRTLLVDTVLATDMSLHFRWIKEFETLIDGMGRAATPGPGPVADAASASETGFAGMSEEERRRAKTFACQALMKCADISNPVRPTNISEAWSRALLNEWAGQATLERSMAIPTSVPSKSPPPVRATIFSSLVESSDRDGDVIMNLNGEGSLQEPGTSQSHIQHHMRSSTTGSSSSDSASSTSTSTSGSATTSGASSSRNSIQQQPWSAADLTSATEQVRVQTSFIDVFTSPLYKQLARFAPELGHFWTRCVRNGVVWSEVGKELERVGSVSASVSKVEAEVVAERPVEVEVEVEAETETETLNYMVSPGMSDFSFTDSGRRRTSFESSKSSATTSTSLSSMLTSGSVGGRRVSECVGGELGEEDDEDEDYHSSQSHEDAEEIEEECVECSFSSSDTAHKGLAASSGVHAHPGAGHPFVVDSRRGSAEGGMPASLAALIHHSHPPSSFRHLRNYSTSSSISRSSYYTARSSASTASSPSSSRSASRQGSVTMTMNMTPMAVTPALRSYATPTQGVGVLRKDFTFGAHPPNSSSINNISLNPFLAQSSISPLTKLPLQASHSNSNSTNSTSTFMSTSSTSSSSASGSDSHYKTFQPLAPLPIGVSPLPQASPIKTTRDHFIVDGGNSNHNHNHNRGHRSEEYRVPLGIEAMRAAYRASSRKRALLASEFECFGDGTNENVCECDDVRSPHPHSHPHHHHHHHHATSASACECGQPLPVPIPVALSGVGYWEFPFRRRSVGPGNLLLSSQAGNGGGGGAVARERERSSIGNVGGGVGGHVPTRSLLVRESIR